MIKHIAYRALSRTVIHPWFRLRRGMTLGVRGAILDKDDQVMLVRHNYAPGWLFPGGGVERGETLRDALIREIREEAGILAVSEPVLHGIFSNEENFRGDHVACFIIRDFSCESWVPSVEIAEAQLFPARALPDGTTAGTRRRLAEILDGIAPSPLW